MGTAALTLLILTSVRYGLATPVIEPVMSEIILQKGDSVTLTCHGNATVEWKLTSNQMKHIQQDNNTIVQIVKATYTDTGTYKCVYASNSSESASVHLFVKEREIEKLSGKTVILHKCSAFSAFSNGSACKDAAEYWNTLVPRVLVDEYTDAVLPCLLTDPSVPKSMIFLKPTKRDQKTPVASFNTKTGYTIHNAQRDYQGSYVCLAKVNGVDKKSKEIQLFVKKVARKPPSVTLESKKHIRIQGEAFHMNCTAASIAKPAIKWKHTTKNITGDSRLDVSENTWIIISTVQIPSVDFDDSGNYTCVGENTAGSNRTSANLQVIEKAFINISTSENTTISLTVGDSVALTVDIEAYPHLRSWTWKHDKSDNAGNAYNNYLQWNLQPNGPYRSRSTLSLNRMKETESGTYTFYAENSKTSAFLNFKIILKTLPSVEIHQILSDGSQKMICTAWGIPLPTIQWLQCPGTSCISKETVPLTDNVTEKIDNNQVISVLNLEENISNATIFCFASNIVGNKSAEILLSTTVLAMTSQVEHMLFNPMLISMTVVGAFLLLLSVFLFYKCQQKPKYEVRWQIVQVSEGNHYTCIDPTQLPYNEKWEFPRANLHFGKTLGAGAFGKVMEATAFGMGKDDSALRVAVKMLKPSAHSDEVEALMSELKILSHLGNHQNIVNLLGACTSGGPILVITEYCQHGDLLNFLRKKAEALNSMFTETLAESTGNYKNMSVEQNDSGFGSKDNSSNVDMKPATSKTNSKQGDLLEDEEDVDDHLPLDLHDLLNFSLQVAQGMSFLASKNCIHRDVAARNVLVTQGRLAKICDFGLARDIENDSNYVVKGNARLPVKWMAPESIFDCIYTVQSDVWSYGILLWEMFSLGRSPYTGIIVNRKFYKMIKEGYKMDCPDYAPIEIYRLMKSCWDLEPTLRPTFNQITDIINRQMNLIKDQEYANIIQGQEDEQCMDVKCVDIQEPLMKGNNYQFR